MRKNWLCDTSLHLVTSLLVRNRSRGITLTSLTTLLVIMKHMSRPKSAAAKDIDIDIADILGQKYWHWPWRYQPTSNFYVPPVSAAVWWTWSEIACSVKLLPSHHLHNRWSVQLADIILLTLLSLFYAGRSLIANLHKTFMPSARLDNVIYRPICPVHLLLNLCEHHISETNEVISMQMDTSGPRARSDQLWGSLDQRSRTREADWRPDRGIILYHFGGVSFSVTIYINNTDCHTVSATRSTTWQSTSCITLLDRKEIGQILVKWLQLQVCAFSAVGCLNACP